MHFFALPTRGFSKSNVVKCDYHIQYVTQLKTQIFRYRATDLHTPIPINNLLALHKQYTNCPSLASGYEVGNRQRNEVHTNLPFSGMLTKYVIN